MNQAASVRAKLLNLAKSQNHEHGTLLMRYALERFLYRLGCSKHREQFVLKGAMLLLARNPNFRRVTKDLDLLGFGDPAEDHILECIRTCCETPVEDDGVTFDITTMTCQPIREELEYGGLRVLLKASIGSAVLPLQIDIGFGDAITPQPEDLSLPTLLGHAAPNLKAYPILTVIAEKIHAITTLGMANTRLKDYYDLYSIAKAFTINPTDLQTALQRTFANRNTIMFTTLPLGLTEEFALSNVKITQWQAFLRRNKINPNELTLTQVVAEITPWLVLVTDEKQ